MSDFFLLIKLALEIFGIIRGSQQKKAQLAKQMYEFIGANKGTAQINVRTRRRYAALIERALQDED